MHFVFPYICVLSFFFYFLLIFFYFFFFFQAEDGIRDVAVTGVQTCALPISVLKPARSATRKVSVCSPRPTVSAPSVAIPLTLSTVSCSCAFRARWVSPQIGRASCRERV